MKVPLLDLKAHHAPICKEIMNAVEKVIENSAFILGPDVRQFEERVAVYCGVGHAVAVSSGTDALLVALMALGVKQDDEVITSPYSFFSTAGVIARLGAKPVFADIDPVTFNIDPREIESKITSRTMVIMPVHLYGQCADMGPILKMAKKHDLKVVEDAAQAIGAEYRDGKRACSMGDIGCLSFFPSKNLGAMGDAGMVATNNPEIAETVRILRVHGSKPKYYHKLIGGNFRMDSMQAAVLNVKLNHLDEWTVMRQKNAENYRRLFEESGLAAKTKLQLPKAVYKDFKVPHYHIYNQFVIRVSERDNLREYLRRESIGSEVYYPVPFHLQECFGYLGYKAGDFPEAEKAANETLALPVYPGLTLAQQEFVVRKIVEFYKQVKSL